MSELFSRYMSGTQFTAGTITGSIMGVSGINPLIDRLNSITTSNNLVTGSWISGTATNIFSDVGSFNQLHTSGTFYISIPAAAFLGEFHPGSAIRINYRYESNEEQPVTTPVFFSDNITVTSCVVYGSGTTALWYLLRSNNIGGGMTTMASAGIGSIDTSISQPVIDNLNYFYSITTENINVGAIIFGARINYTEN